MRLADFVAAFELSDHAASNGLDEYEFRDLVVRVMPEATEAQVGWGERSRGHAPGWLGKG
jgi:hypothetical protein